MKKPHSRLLIFFFLTLICTIPVSHGISGYFKPSVSSGYSYRWYYKSWVNYCPACGHSGCLLINPKGVPESELTCSVCDADYCGVTGWDKGGKRWRLIPASIQSRGGVKIRKIDMSIVVMGIELSKHRKEDKIYIPLPT